MFNTDAAADNDSKKTTRRAFIAASVVSAGGLGALWIFRSPGVEASVVVHGAPGVVTIVNFSDAGENLGKQTVSKVVKTDGEWYRQLGKNSFGITRQADTEVPYSGDNWNEHRKGIYRCICCDSALFSSTTKFESGTGWPSFWAPMAKENVLERTDVSMGMERTEVACTRCEGHLGHVFSDGPEPTGLRYCMNSASMRFVKS